MAEKPRAAGGGGGAAVPAGVDRDAATASVGAGRKEAPAPRPRGLVVVHDGQLAHRVLPVPARLTLGRGADAEVQLDGAAVSRLHAVVSASAEGLRIEDRQSSHGVFVDGDRIGAPQLLRAGSVVRLGTSLLVAVDDAPSHERVGATGATSATGATGAQGATAAVSEGTVLAGTATARRAVDFAAAGSAETFR